MVLDDGHLVGELPALNSCYAEMPVAFQAVGLRVNPRKCHLFTLGDLTHVPVLQQHATHQRKGIAVLGTPVGSEGYIRQSLSSKFRGVHDFVTKVTHLGDPQIAVALLRMCAGACRVVHLLRTVPPDLVAPFAQELDSTMLDALQQVAGVPLTETAALQVFLPHRLGGLGLQLARTQCATAFLTAFVAFRTPEAEAFPQMPLELVQLATGEVSRALEMMACEVAPAEASSMAWLKEALSTPPVRPLPDQGNLWWWNERRANHAYEQVLRSASARDCARLRCQADSEAGSWLQACPSSGLGLRLNPTEFMVLLRWWLGIPLVPADTSLSCPSCGDSMDCFGDHLLCCKLGGFWTRHKAIVDMLYHFGRAAGLTVTLEVAIGGLERPADLMFSPWKGSGPLAVDPAVVHPLAPSTSYAAIKNGSEAIEFKARVKSNHYSEKCSESNVQFAPFVLSTFGKMGDDARDLLRDLAKARRGVGTLTPEAVLVHQYQQQLQVVLRRQVARMLLQGVGDIQEISLPPPIRRLEYEDKEAGFRVWVVDELGCNVAQ